jgi:cell division septal protein FtsQ
LKIEKPITRLSLETFSIIKSFSVSLKNPSVFQIKLQENQPLSFQILNYDAQPFFTNRRVEIIFLEKFHSFVR